MSSNLPTLDARSHERILLAERGHSSASVMFDVAVKRITRTRMSSFGCCDRL